MIIIRKGIVDRDIMLSLCTVLVLATADHLHYANFAADSSTRKGLPSTIKIREVAYVRKQKKKKIPKSRIILLSFIYLLDTGLADIGWLCLFFLGLWCLSLLAIRMTQRHIGCDHVAHQLFLGNQMSTHRIRNNQRLSDRKK